MSIDRGILAMKYDISEADKLLYQNNCAFNN